MVTALAHRLAHSHSLADQQQGKEQPKLPPRISVFDVHAVRRPPSSVYDGGAKQELYVALKVQLGLEKLVKFYAQQHESTLLARTQRQLDEHAAAVARLRESVRPSLEPFVSSFVRSFVHSFISTHDRCMHRLSRCPSCLRCCRWPRQRASIRCGCRRCPSLKHAS